MEDKPVFLSTVEKQCEQIKNSQYLKCIEKDDIRVVLLSIFNIKKVINDQNLLIAINMTKIDNEYQKELCKVLYDNVCIKNTEQKFLEFIEQFDVSQDYLKKNSSLIPYDVLINDLSKFTLDNCWQQSIVSLATTEYIFSLLFLQLNKFTNENQVKLNTTNTNCIQLLKILDSQQIYTNEIENGINQTVKSYLSMFEILCEIFFSDYTN